MKGCPGHIVKADVDECYSINMMSADDDDKIGFKLKLNLQFTCVSLVCHAKILQYREAGDMEIIMGVFIEAQQDYCIMTSTPDYDIQ